MLIDPSVIPGLLLLAGELIALAVAGFVVVRVVLGQTDDRLALAQGLVVGLALWGLIVNFVLYLWPGYGGALASWAVVAVFAAGLAWRGRERMRVNPRLAVGFGATFLVLFWIALASRQLLPIPDSTIHYGLIGVIRAGGPHPPGLSWNPGLAAPYHYGVDLLIGLLTPPFGPDPAFVTELLGAYIWTSYALIVLTLLIWRGSWAMAAVLAPLLLAAETQAFLTRSPGVLQVAIPGGVPAPGLRASIAAVYLEGVSENSTWPPNIWKPDFPLAYALALVVLQRAIDTSSSYRLAQGVLAMLIGFLSVVDAVIAFVVLAAWGGFAAISIVTARRGRPIRWNDCVRSLWGPALGALLLGTGGGVITSFLVEGSGSGISYGWKENTSLRPPLGSFTALPGGLALLGLGPFVTALGAALLARRNALSVALAACSGLCLLSALTLQYEYAQHDVTRLDGHARNFALLALLVALSVRLANLPTRWRYAAGVVIVGLVTWPTVVSPVRGLGPALRQGVQLANAEAAEQVPGSTRSGRRGVFPRFRSERIVDFIQEHTPPEARVLSPDPMAMTAASGRPNAVGFTQAAHYVYTSGPEYQDAIRYLDPTAVKRLGIGYVHVSDAWIEGLPDHARGWLNDPSLFEPVIRDGSDALLRVRQAYRELETPPPPASFEALRRAVPASATVYFEPATDIGNALRVASALAHARFVGELALDHIHVRTDFGIEPLGEHRPDFVVAPRWFTPSMFPPAARRPVWWNRWVAVYALDGGTESVMPVTDSALPPVSVEVSDDGAEDERAAFIVTLINRAREQWTGQDWLVLPAGVGGLPLLPRLGKSEAVLWFSGQIAPEHETTRLTYEFDPRGTTLSVRAGDGRLTAAGGGGDALVPGSWSLVLRLNRAVKHRTYVGQEAAAYIPIMHVDIADDGAAAFTVYEGDLQAGLRS